MRTGKSLTFFTAYPPKDYNCKFRIHFGNILIPMLTAEWLHASSAVLLYRIFLIQTELYDSFLQLFGSYFGVRLD
jgi:hypothetical protein